MYKLRSISENEWAIINKNIPYLYSKAITVDIFYLLNMIDGIKFAKSLKIFSINTIDNSDELDESDDEKYEVTMYIGECNYSSLSQEISYYKVLKELYRYITLRELDPDNKIKEIVSSFYENKRRNDFEK